MTNCEKIALADALCLGGEATIRYYLETVVEIEAIEKSFEQYPMAFCWRKNERHDKQYVHRLEDRLLERA